MHGTRHLCLRRLPHSPRQSNDRLALRSQSSGDRQQHVGIAAKVTQSRHTMVVADPFADEMNAAFSDDGQPIQREPVLAQLRQRMRDVRMGPDELLYVLTDQNPGVLLRIEPAE